MSTPPSVVSIAARRLPSWFELSMRRNSSTAVSIVSGCSARSRSASGWRSSRSTRVADQVGGGLVAGIEQEDAVVQKLRAPTAGRLLVAARARFRCAPISVERISPRIVAGRLALAARHEIAKIILEIGDRGRRRRRTAPGSAPARARRGSSATSCATDRARPAECRACRRSSCTGIAAAKSSIRSMLPRSAAVSSRRSTSASMRGCNARSARGVNGGREQLAHAGVDRRVVEDEARRVVLVEQAVAEIRLELELLVRAPGVGVAIDRDAVVVAGEEIRAVGHAMHRVVLAERAIGRIGVVEEFGAEPAQIELGRRPPRPLLRQSSQGRRGGGDHCLTSGQAGLGGPNACSPGICVRIW